MVARINLWKFSSAGRASALQAEGHRFEPCNFHFTFGEVPKWLKGIAWKAVRSLIAARGFKSLLLRHLRSVGQGVKTPPFHGGNMGSNPIRIIKYFR